MRRKNINFLEIDKIEKNHIKIIKSHNPDVGILLAYGVLIPQNVIDLFTYGIINIHPSMLQSIADLLPYKARF